jgi:hypothetical protein
MLEHIEECIKCKNHIIKAVEENMSLSDYGNLFKRNIQEQSIPQYIDFKNPVKFIGARILWRKRKLQDLINRAEIELVDLETRL